MNSQKDINVQDRLKAFLEYSKISNSEFGRRIGVSSAYVTSIRKSIQPDKLEKISREFPSLNITWLVTGEGSMLTDQDDSLHDPGDVKKVSDEKVIRYWSDLTATGGGLESFDDVKSDYVPLILPDFRDCTDAVNVIGESMSPTYKNGSIILIKEWTESFIEYGNAYLIITCNGNRMIKYIRPSQDNEHVICASENPDFPPFEVKKEDILRLYVVKGVISKMAM